MDYYQQPVSIRVERNARTINKGLDNETRKPAARLSQNRSQCWALVVLQVAVVNEKTDDAVIYRCLSLIARPSVSFSSVIHHL